jgi:hypothetical protein
LEDPADFRSPPIVSGTRGFPCVYREPGGSLGPSVAGWRRSITDHSDGHLMGSRTDKLTSNTSRLLVTNLSLPQSYGVPLVCTRPTQRSRCKLTHVVAAASSSIRALGWRVDSTRRVAPPCGPRPHLEVVSVRVAPEGATSPDSAAERRLNGASARPAQAESRSGGGMRPA